MYYFITLYFFALLQILNCTKKTTNKRTLVINETRHLMEVVIATHRHLKGNTSGKRPFHSLHMRGKNESDTRLVLQRQASMMWRWGLLYWRGARL